MVQKQQREMPVVRRPGLALPPLSPFREGELGPEGDHDGVAFEDLDLSGQSAIGTMFLDCGLHRCRLDDAALGRARFLDSLLDSVSGVGTDLAGAQLRDVELRDARLGGTKLQGAAFDRVLIRGGKLEFLNLRQAELTDVAFEGCVLVEPDFSGARLRRVSFDGCTLRRSDLTGAELQDVDLRGAVELDIASGSDRLSGTVISSVQLTELAPVLAAQLGLRVQG
ncbi:pentapeptide repeat-containing protein [Streptomyces sulphureus]|uniref:pentapeptide repeat-containing protein n=1 Tax=Streptomyces sulphureus TaxID=47758 RepID=UPI00039B65F9